MQRGKELKEAGGWAGSISRWLMSRFRNRPHIQPRLALVERIALAPRQSLALVEAEGQRILVATSADGGSAFHPLHEDTPRRQRIGRISW